jgi:hypothetical protein
VILQVESFLSKGLKTHVSEQEVRWRAAFNFVLLGCADGTVYIWQLTTDHLDRIATGKVCLRISHRFLNLLACQSRQVAKAILANADPLPVDAHAENAVATVRGAGPPGRLVIALTVSLPRLCDVVATPMHSASSAVLGMQNAMSASPPGVGHDDHGDGAPDLQSAAAAAAAMGTADHDSNGARSSASSSSSLVALAAAAAATQAAAVAARKLALQILAAFLIWDKTPTFIRQQVFF